jgi:hypothetical protein
MNATTPAIKMEMIEGSLRCFVRGLWGFLPLIGLPLAVMALSQYMRVGRISAGQWNPAHRYVFWGMFCAWLALGLWLLEVVAAVMVMMNMAGN